MKKKDSKLKAFFTHPNFLRTIFWVYNVIYLGAVMLAFTPIFLNEFLFSNFLPWNVALMIYVLVLVPFGALWFGLFTKAKKEPRKLIAFLFAVELPIVFLALARIFMIRQMTGIMWVIFLSMLISIIGLLYMMLNEKIKSFSKRIALFLSQKIAVIVGLYFAFLAVFFLPIIIGGIVRVFIEIDFWDYLFEIIVETKGLAFLSFIFYALLFILTVGFLMIAPFVAFVVYWRALKSNREELESKFKYKKARPLGYLFGAIYVVVMITLSFQWRSDSYSNLIQSYIEADNFETQQQVAQELASYEQSIRSRLKNDYLAPYRFLTDERINILEGSYSEFVGFSDDSSVKIQKLFNFFASPFIYHGNFRENSNQAAQWYAELFDMPLQEGERNDIVKALEATNARDNLRAGILDEESNTVHLVSRKIEAKTEEDDLLAIVTVEDEYENTSDSIQEVYYEFTLPEDAVVTGLWLGPNLEETGVIAPKGAAQRVYEEQIRARIDPALLEQTGPRQYRLRVYPIPTERDFFNSRNEDVPNMRVKFEYATFVSPQGIMTPEMNVVRNLYSDRKTVFETTLDGSNVESRDFIALAADHCESNPYMALIDTGVMTFTPHHLNSFITDYDCSDASLKSLNQIEGKRIAFLMDTSYSNSQKDWGDYLSQSAGDSMVLESLLQNNLVDAYFFSDYLSKPTQLTLENLSKLSVIHFGKTDRLNALENLANDYDAIFMFTDESDDDESPDVLSTTNDSFNARDDESVLIESIVYGSKAPVYIIHGGSFPQYNDELSLEVIRSGGGTFSDLYFSQALSHLILDDAAQKLALDLNADHLMGFTESTDESNSDDGLVALQVDQLKEQVVSVNQYGTWTRYETDDVNSLSYENDIMNILANQQAIEHFIRSSEEDLRAIHQIALNQGIVSPYSSYIALVTDRQRDQLEAESVRDDAFESEFNTGEQNLNAPSPAGVVSLGGVPEPEEWALMIAAVLMLGYFYRQPIFGWIRKRK